MRSAGGTPSKNMQPATMINLPDASTSLAAVGAYSSPVFTSFLPMGLMLVGILLGGLIVYAVINALIGGVKAAIGMRHEGTAAYMRDQSRWDN